MKISATSTFFSANSSKESSSWLDFLISKGNSRLQLFKKGKLVGCFEEIRQFANWEICVCRENKEYFVVNQQGVLYGPYAQVGDVVFEAQGSLFIEVRKQDTKGNSRMNVLDITAGTYLYLKAEHHKFKHYRFSKRQQDFLTWPCWKGLKDMDEHQIIIERSEGNYAFYANRTISGASVEENIDRYQRLPQGGYIVHNTSKKVKGEYVEIDQEGNKVKGYCFGFLTDEELQKMADDTALLQPAKDEIPQKVVKMTPAKAVSENTFAGDVLAAARQLLTLSSKERVAEALSLMFGERVSELLSSSPAMDRCWKKALPQFEDVVNDVYLDKVRAYFEEEELADDYDTCRKYWQRHLDSPHAVLMKLRAEFGISDTVERAIESLRQNLADSFRPSKEQIRSCFLAMVEELEEKALAA